MPLSLDQDIDRLNGLIVVFSIQPRKYDPDVITVYGFLRKIVGGNKIQLPKLFPPFRFAFFIDLLIGFPVFLLFVRKAFQRKLQRCRCEGLPLLILPEIRTGVQKIWKVIVAHVRSVRVFCITLGIIQYHDLIFRLTGDLELNIIFR